GLSGSQAFRWRPATGMVPLGHLPFPFNSGAVAYAVSSDGEVVAGWDTSAFDPNPWEAFRWTSKTGMQRVGRVVGSGELEGTSIFGLSADGSVMVGVDDINGVKWVYGVENSIAVPTFRVAYAVSGDGHAIFGNNHSSITVRWTAKEGTVSLGDLPGGSASGTAL